MCVCVCVRVYVNSDQLCHTQVREDLKAAKSQGFVIMCLASFDEMWGKKHVIEGHELVVEFQV